MKTKLRILIVHNAYQQAGGEDSVMGNEYDMLVKNGHETQIYSVSNDSIRTTGDKIRALINTPYNAAAAAALSVKLDEFRPDIVHVHNFFPLLTPAIYDACADAGIPVVQTLHNYRTVCSGALLMRDNAVCEKCVTGSPLWGVVHRCYRNSLPGSVAVARMVSMHRSRGTWNNKVDRFIALTEFSRRKFIEAGFPADRISIKPNFIPQTTEASSGPREAHALFVGRISKEKGLHILMEAWKNVDAPLRVIGDGPLLDEIRGLAPPHVEFLGRRAPPEVLGEMSKASFLVMPSIWYEAFGMTIVEAMSCGLPVVASRLGSMAEIVEDGKTGLHFTSGSATDLAEKARWAFSNLAAMQDMGENAQKTYQAKYTPTQNYTQLLSIYEAAQVQRSHAG